MKKLKRRSAKPKVSDHTTSNEEKKRREQMEVYRRYVAEVAEAADGEIILNRSPEHAAIIVEYLFRRAESEVDILTLELNEIVYGEKGVIDAAMRFLQDHPSAKLNILSEKSVDKSSHPFLRALKRAGLMDRVDLRVVPEWLQQEYGYNFAVADGRHFRFEKEREHFDAVVQFGEKTVGEKLRSIFHTLQHRVSASRKN
jgi:hypothetical protein